MLRINKTCQKASQIQTAAATMRWAQPLGITAKCIGKHKIDKTRLKGCQKEMH